MKMMRKAIALLLAAVSVMLTLTACGSESDGGGKMPNETDEVTPDIGVVTDFNTGDVELHEAILPWEYDEGEDIDNPYYKRTTDVDGNLVYAVLQASTNQPAYLPMGNTVVYSGNFETCFYERTTVSYTENGEHRSNVQYQLYVTALVARPEINDTELVGAEADA